MNKKLDGKVALITGAGRGIGRSIALKLASEGARVIINDMDSDVGHQCLEDIKKIGGEGRLCVGNVADPDFPNQFIAMAVNSYDGLDIIINNAGYTWDSVIQNITEEQWYAIVDCHLTAPFRLLRAAQPVIRSYVQKEKINGDRIIRKVVNTSSVAGMFGNAGQANYASAKAGVIGLTQTLAKEWGRINVTVNCVAYGLIETRLTAHSANEGASAKIDGREIKIGISQELMQTMARSIPLGRAGTTDEAAGSVYLFCIPESDYISGQTIMCSGGLTGI